MPTGLPWPWRDRRQFETATPMPPWVIFGKPDIRSNSGFSRGGYAVHQPLTAASRCWVAAATHLFRGSHSSVSCRFRLQRHQGITRCSILLPQVSHNASDVEPEGSGVSPSDGPDVLDDFVGKISARAVIRFDHGQSSNSSSGVQITGVSKPDAAQTSAMRFRIVALAMCRQFHVRR